MLPFVSDVAADDHNRVFTTGVNPILYNGGYVQMLDPARSPVVDPATGVLTAPVRRWDVGNGTGTCVSTGPSVTLPAGGYTVRMRNTGTVPIKSTPTVVVRQPLLK